MLSRRLLRVKVMQTVYSYSQSGEQTLDAAETELYHSISKSHELYHALLLFPIALADYAQKRIEAGRNKIRPTADEMNPNLRFVNNKLIAQLRENESLLSYVDSTGLSWVNNEDYLSKFFNNLIASKFYTDYMTMSDDSYEEDKKFIINLISKRLAYDEMFYETMENTSIYWNDEIEFIISIVTKTLKDFNINSKANQPLLPEFKDKEDALFVKMLFRNAIANNSAALELIKKFSQNWDAERVALLDVILIRLAMAEIESVPDIPIKVTMNEYIEISKYYSTEKSHIYINGILEKIINYLVENKKILKERLPQA